MENFDMNSPRVIDLNGPEGNIFAVVGLLIAECKKVGTEPPQGGRNS